MIMQSFRVRIVASYTRVHVISMDMLPLARSREAVSDDAQQLLVQ
jgi:hypothetical protein